MGDISRTTYADLPPECLLRVAAFLTLTDIIVLLQTSRLWYSIITENEQVVYRQLAASYGSMDMAAGSLDDALKGWASREASRVQNWKQYCQLQVATKRRWHGKGRTCSSYDVFGPAQRTEVHRIKIDTGKSLLVMTGEGDTDDDGCVIVHCLRNPRRQALFHIKQVASYAHVELSNGFIVFTCNRNDVLEVWRWAQDQDAHFLDRSPTQQQQHMYENAMKSAGLQMGLPHRGELVPMGVLELPDELTALRLAYPTLCVGSRVGDRLWLWDIRTRKLVQTIELDGPANPRFTVLYVDVNETYAFVATDTVAVYSRATSQCVFQLQESQLALLATCVDIPSAPPTSQSEFQQCELPDYHNTGLRIVPLHFPRDAVRAVHVSPAGDDFVAISFHGLILHISGFKSGVSEGSETSSKSLLALDNFRISFVHADSNLTHLAYDGDRIVAYGAQGLCIINIGQQPDNTFEVLVRDGPTLKLYPFPSKYLCRVYPFGDEDGDYDDCSCLQLTRDSFWVAWIPEVHRIPQYFRRHHGKVVGMMDFARTR